MNVFRQPAHRARDTSVDIGGRDACEELLFVGHTALSPILHTADNNASFFGVRWLYVGTEQYRYLDDVFYMLLCITNQLTFICKCTSLLPPLPRTSPLHLGLLSRPGLNEPAACFQANLTPPRPQQRPALNATMVSSRDCRNPG